MSRGATARLFVAVDPPAFACEQLAEWARGVAGALRAGGSARGSLRLLDPESLHLTLCFLGSRPVGEIEPLGAALVSCAEHVCELSVGAPLWLPPRRPNALAVEVHDRDGELQHIQERVCESLCAASAWRPERRRFRPHITLARMRGGERVARHRELPATPWLSFSPEAIVLYRSWLTPAGARYEALASSELLAVGR
jgi:2'-5' RNA ligase